MKTVRQEIDDLWEEIEKLKSAGSGHLAATKVLHKRVRELEVELAHLKMKLKKKKT